MAGAVPQPHSCLEELPQQPQLGRIKQVDLCLGKLSVCSGLEREYIRFLLLHNKLPRTPGLTTMPVYYLTVSLGHRLFSARVLTRLRSRWLQLPCSPEPGLLSQAPVVVVESSCSELQNAGPCVLPAVSLAPPSPSISLEFPAMGRHPP